MLAAAFRVAVTPMEWYIRLTPAPAQIVGGLRHIVDGPSRLGELPEHAGGAQADPGSAPPAA